MTKQPKKKPETEQPAAAEGAKNPMSTGMAIAAAIGIIILMGLLVYVAK